MHCSADVCYLVDMSAATTIREDLVITVAEQAERLMAAGFTITRLADPVASVEYALVLTLTPAERRMARELVGLDADFGAMQDGVRDHDRAELARKQAADKAASLARGRRALARNGRNFPELG